MIRRRKLPLLAILVAVLSVVATPASANLFKKSKKKKKKKKKDSSDYKTKFPWEQGGHKRCPSGTTILELVLCSSGAPGTYDNDRKDFDIVRELVLFADLADGLGDGPDALDEITLFLPDDRAFYERMVSLDSSMKGYDEEKTAYFFKENLDVEGITAVLFYHVVMEEYDAEELRDNFGDEIDTFLGQSVTPDRPKKRGHKRIRIKDQVDSFPEPKIHNAFNSLDVSNGIVHVIKAVLMPDFEKLMEDAP